MALAAVLALLL